MLKMKGFFQFVWFVFISGAGGFVLSLTGLPIVWMIGTLLTATFLSIRRPKFLKVPSSQKGIPKYWLFIGQCILGIELGQKVNRSVLTIFQDNWSTITIMLLLSIFFSLLSGLFLWKFSNLDMLTSFFATTPGGLSSIPGIAEEVGANTGVVSIIQVMRVFLVILTIPVAISLWVGNAGDHVNNHTISDEITIFEAEPFVFTLLFVPIACIGYFLGKRLKFPAPWLIGSMVSIAAVKAFGSVMIGYDLIAWWPESLMIVSQVFIGSSIGSRFHKEMFEGLTKTLMISFLSTIGLIVSMFLCAYIVSIITDISLLTSSLAFAPGGIAEMTTTALVLNGDATLVVAVQVLRIIAVCIILPPLFRFLKYFESKRNARSRLSA
ncbi:MAG: AbrB family transcriptional regulator [Bacillota bacterium]